MIEDIKGKFGSDGRITLSGTDFCKEVYPALAGEKIRAAIPYISNPEWMMIIFDSGNSMLCHMGGSGGYKNELWRKKETTDNIKKSVDAAQKTYDDAKRVLSLALDGNAPKAEE